MNYVLDTWPVMEWLKDRRHASDLLDHLLERAKRQEVFLHMSMINLGEVYYTSIREWGEGRADEIIQGLRQLPIRFAEASTADIFAAARLKAHGGIAYADCFAAALAVRTGSRLVTGDLDFQVLERRGVLQLEWLGA